MRVLTASSQHIYGFGLERGFLYVRKGILFPQKSVTSGRVTTAKPLP
ncbi:hypothetical protein [Bacillus massilinigeriensis]|nr:hypothetical protein [Bacillus mediterraneensis]